MAWRNKLITPMSSYGLYQFPGVEGGGVAFIALVVVSMLSPAYLGPKYPVEAFVRCLDHPRLLHKLATLSVFHVVDTAIHSTRQPWSSMFM